MFSRRIAVNRQTPNYVFQLLQNRELCLEQAHSGESVDDFAMCAKCALRQAHDGNSSMGSVQSPNRTFFFFHCIAVEQHLVGAVRSPNEAMARVIYIGASITGFN